MESPVKAMIDAPSEAITIFAYGSNMLAARVMARVPSVRLPGPASLERFVLRWNKPIEGWVRQVQH